MKPEKLILDYSKWRCGGEQDTPNKLGQGPTMLLNSMGFSCCLGQWSKQLGASDDDLLHNLNPVDMNFKIPLFISSTNYHHESDLATDCLIINDDDHTSPEEKINKLAEVLSKEGIQLEVINKP